MFIFTRPIETPRFKAVAGMPLPARFNTSHGRKFLRDRFGEDVITELDYQKPESFMALIAKDSDASVREQFGKLKMLTESQAKTIRQLERENEQLKKQLARARAPERAEGLKDES